MSAANVGMAFSVDLDAIRRHLRYTDPLLGAKILELGSRSISTEAWVSLL